jgi:hypothetical protein
VRARPLMSPIPSLISSAVAFLLLGSSTIFRLHPLWRGEVSNQASGSWGSVVAASVCDSIKSLLSYTLDFTDPLFYPSSFGLVSVSLCPLAKSQDSHLPFPPSGGAYTSPSSDSTIGYLS